MPSFGQLDFADPNINVDIFAPTGLDIDQWLDACVSAGMTYAILTAKHHDGFALWPTAYHNGANPPYSIAQTAWYAANGSPDVVGLFVTKCRTRNLKPVLYYSIRDETFSAQGGAIVMDMVTAQITELLTNYGAITALWLDGWLPIWQLFLYAPPADVYNLIKSLQPNCLMIGNNSIGPSYISQIDVWELAEVPEGNTRPAERTASIRNAGGWFYHSGEDQSAGSLRSAADINAAIAYANANGAAYALDLQPGTDGHLTAAQVSLLAGVHP